MPKIILAMLMLFSLAFLNFGILSEAKAQGVANLPPEATVCMDRSNGNISFKVPCETPFTDQGKFATQYKGVCVVQDKTTRQWAVGVPNGKPGSLKVDTKTGRTCVLVDDPTVVAGQFI